MESQKTPETANATGTPTSDPPAAKETRHERKPKKSETALATTKQPCLVDVQAERVPEPCLSDRLAELGERLRADDEIADKELGEIYGAADARAIDIARAHARQRGELLKEARDLIVALNRQNPYARCTFKSWVEQNCNYSIRTAHLYIAATDEMKWKQITTKRNEREQMKRARAQHVALMADAITVHAEVVDEGRKRIKAKSDANNHTPETADDWMQVALKAAVSVRKAVADADKAEKIENTSHLTVAIEAVEREIAGIRSHCDHLRERITTMVQPMPDDEKPVCPEYERYTLTPTSEAALAAAPA